MRYAFQARCRNVQWPLRLLTLPTSVFGSTQNAAHLQCGTAGSFRNRRRRSRLRQTRPKVRFQQLIHHQVDCVPCRASTASSRRKGCKARVLVPSARNNQMSCRPGLFGIVKLVFTARTVSGNTKTAMLVRSSLSAPHLYFGQIPSLRLRRQRTLQATHHRGNHVLP